MEIDSDWMLGSAKDSKKRNIEMSVWYHAHHYVYTLHLYSVVLTVGAVLDGVRLGDSVGAVLGSDDGFC